MIVYHGSTIEIVSPDNQHSLRHLDFGQGFYVTPVLIQAERWAKRKADLISQNYAIINEYEMLDNWQNFNVKIFNDDNIEEWLDFVANCRNGNDLYKNFDLISGKVADDKVYRVVNMYLKGIFDKERALKELKIYENYQQIALISQQSINELLTFKQSIVVNL
ncbi:MAG: DUF3990 domain-containing protein [Neisseriaceae bacterium]|nr:DUF3990 domain-containing protein [Neisseriaceae bacterium]MBR5676098.1 DUF3990 domain-containing protein [Neisseriaceae bacterium]MBR5940075.1 DUF3990 domain-containing protein [Neisseriaceae bacterium]